MDPAYAGMILSEAVGAVAIQRGPRVCGDDPMLRVVLELIGEWTPRMRG